MDLDDELPRIQTSAAGMHQEPCGSETTTSGVPVPVTEDWIGPGNRQNKQSTHQTMMKKGWNRCPTPKTR